jgi:hypothetical protein
MDVVLYLMIICSFLDKTNIGNAYRKVYKKYDVLEAPTCPKLSKSTPRNTNMFSSGTPSENSRLLNVY